MNSSEISYIVLACTFGGSLCGMMLRVALPKDHLSTDAKDLIKLGMGLIGTMTALALGLLIASARDSYDAKSKELTDMSANLVLLDRTLAHYGAETGPIRSQVQLAVTRLVDQTWPKTGAKPSQPPDPTAIGSEPIYDKIQALSPNSDAQRSLQSQALALSMAVAKTRWLLFAQGSNSVAAPFLAVLISWLTILFLSFGLQAPFNATILVALLVCSVVVSSAIFLILELYQPFSGLIQIPDTPLRAALMHLNSQ
jgi:hypothetical protein